MQQFRWKTWKTLNYSISLKQIFSVLFIQLFTTSLALISEPMPPTSSPDDAPSKHCRITGLSKEKRLKLSEIIGVTVTVSIIYLSALYSLSHHLLTASSKEDFWGFLPSVWDHPEPNYIFTFWISEFFSVITAIPIAGYLLMYNSWKYQYSNVGHRKVIGLYCIICTMYSFAFIAHSTLSPVLMSCTLTAVLTNGVYTFYQYSYITGMSFLQSPLIRGIICIVAQSVIVYSVITLPYLLGPYGGVPTLTVVQTPAVLLATVLVYLEIRKLRNAICANATCVVSGEIKSINEQHQLRNRKIRVYELLLFSGILLCGAMGVSFVEISMERDNVYILGSFPYLHVVIHVLEQIGIYHYGIGVAALQYLVICNEPQSELDYVHGIIPFIYRTNEKVKAA